MGWYTNAAVCKRGHVIARDTSCVPIAERCTDCGARVLTACPSCHQPIRGEYETEGVAMIGFGWDPPSFCHSCGSAFSWVGRKERIYELQNRLDDEDLDPADELAVREALSALAEEDVGSDHEEELKRWQRVRERAPTFWEHSGVRSIVETVASAWVKKQLELGA